jgi:hypothetical protein
VTAFNIAKQHLPSWHDRADKAAQLAKEVGKPLTIADIGCGDRKLVHALHSRGVDFTYDGFDLIPQSPETIAYDIRIDHLPRRYDLLMALGLFEYLSDLKALLKKLRHCGDNIVVSHVTADNPTRRYSQEDIARLGWINHLTAQEFEDALSEAGYMVIRTVLTGDGVTRLWLAH